MASPAGGYTTPQRNCYRRTPAYTVVSPWMGRALIILQRNLRDCGIAGPQDQFRYGAFQC
jgi:hypothetical protein